MPPLSSGPDTQDVCASCKADVTFHVDTKTGVTTCPLCGTRQRDAVVGTARPRAGRRVVDIDTSASPPRKAPPERTKAESRHIAAVKKELKSHRPASGALDGSGAAVAAFARGSAVSASADRAQTDALRARWRELTADLMSRDGRPHRDTDTYEAGAVILHTKHGMGLVESIGEDGTLVALFRGGFVSLPSTPKAD